MRGGRQVDVWNLMRESPGASNALDHVHGCLGILQVKTFTGSTDSDAQDIKILRSATVDDLAEVVGPVQKPRIFMRRIHGENDIGIGDLSPMRWIREPPHEFWADRGAHRVTSQSAPQRVRRIRSMVATW
jgi:hypothetical protein